MLSLTETERKGEGALSISSYKDTNHLSDQNPALMTLFILTSEKILSPNIPTLRVRALAYETVGGHNSVHTNWEIHGDERAQESKPINLALNLGAQP